MRTVVPYPQAELQSWLDRRRAWGQDLFDEVWVGEYRVAPAPSRAHAVVDHQVALLLGQVARAVGLVGAGRLNIGASDDYRVPDQAYLRGHEAGVYAPTAAIVVEILSPGDESVAKLPFWFARDVEEVLHVDPVTRTAQWLVRGAKVFEPAPASAVLGVTSDSIAAGIDWPSVAQG